MLKKDIDALKEGLKELLRTALMAALPLVISGLQAGKVDWRAVGVATVIVVLSAIDRWAHKQDIGVLGNGLTGV